MLTATYTLVALSVEQASVRVSLQSFQQYVRANLMQQNSITLGQLEYACETLNRLYQACHWRKIEMYLIPAIRQATERADQLLDELSRLNQAALAVIRAMQERIGGLHEGAEEQVSQICASIETFCSALLQRLEKEEKELFAIARSVICGEAWFAIANQFLLHDAKMVEERRARSAAPITLPTAATAAAATASAASAAAVASAASAAAVASAAAKAASAAASAAAIERLLSPRLALLPLPPLDMTADSHEQLEAPLATGALSLAALDLPLADPLARQ
ncbi:hemerythrin domain-containing protein [Rugamonas sp. CCM 8940]|uniref:hemerythrin domain-containing protein n=1 Tax=Rugamonas sp. CCM 8940 TaxID=2765359 RepID=UPI0018F79E95|nr:hemerythrin domain-containing protein [Rugamonas sp. CCM 8940]MBJ7309022.1 hemerythrin domain-containing protein [Rugamonas sp. CCM 8940]